MYDYCYNILHFYKSNKMEGKKIFFVIMATFALKKILSYKIFLFLLSHLINS